MLRYIELDRHVTDRSPPTFLWHTAEDTTVPAAQSILMADALTRAQVPVALHIFPRGRHGLGLASESRLAGQWPDLLRDWLVEMDFLAGSISEVGA
jgi:acetyl esterase/lipase